MMRLAFRALALALLLLAAPGLIACNGADAPAGTPGCSGYGLDGSVQDFPLGRVFRGRLLLPPAKDLPLPARPFQVLALGFEPEGGTLPDAGPPKKADGGATGDGKGATPAPRPGAPTDKVVARLFYGDAFRALEGGGERPAIPFAVVVPCTVSVNLMLQVLRTSGDKQPGYQVAQLTFARGDTVGTPSTLIPRQAADACGGKANQLDLGLVTLTLGKRGVLSSGAIVLGKGNSKNPLELVGAPEGTVTDQDQDGDGILDSAQTFAALPDRLTPGTEPDPAKPAPDGIPDLFQ